MSNNQPGNDYSNGLIELATWEGGTTGNPFADLLMGGPLASYQEIDEEPP